MADNYAPFYSLPIECTDRDAAFVLDGLPRSTSLVNSLAIGDAMPGGNARKQFRLENNQFFQREG